MHYALRTHVELEIMPAWTLLLHHLH